MDPNQMPAAPPPPGHIPDFNSPDNYKQRNIILHTVVLSFTTVAVFIRVYTRAIIKKNFSVDDWFALLSWVLAIEFSVALAYATTLGFGMHLYDVRATVFLKTIKWIVVSQKTYFPLILSIKLCILIGYLRIFQIDRVTKWGLWFGVFACTVFYVVAFFADMFRCKPVEAAWNPMIKGTCLSYAAMPWATGIFNISSDFYILVLPLPPILRMNMPLARRLRVAAIFGLGLFTCVMSIMRFESTLRSANHPDKTYEGGRDVHWAVLEINVGLICACGTVFPAFFDASAPRSFGSLVAGLLSKNSTSQTNVSSPHGVEIEPKESNRSSEQDCQRKGMRWNIFTRRSKDSLHNVRDV